MRKTLIALGLALSLSAGAQAQSPLGPPNQILCNKQAQIAVGTAAGVGKVISGIAGQVVVICGWHVTNSAAAGTFQISSGTGTNCGTNNAVMTPAFTVTSTAPSSDHVEYAEMQAPVGSDVCFNPSVTTIGALLWYNQQ